MSKIFLNQIQEAAQLSLFTTNNLGAPAYFNCATANRVVAINSAGNAFELKSFANWDTAFSWGNHASAGYLTSFTETDPVFSASAASSITNTNISNWNTAFGWGNHASAGYITSNQTITLSGQVTGSGTTSITTSLATNTVGDTHIRQSAGLSVIGRSANSTGNVADITAGSDNQVLRRSGTSIGFGTVATAGIANSAVTLAKIANITTSRILGRVTAGSGVVEELTGTQATSLLDLFSTSTTTKGLVPGSNGVAATHYLDASGNWSVPAGGGGGGSGTVTSVSMTVPTGFSISGSPITTSGTLGLTFAAGYSLPTDANQANWSTAYSWGNHASAGYLTSIATNSIGNSQLRQSNGYSVIGRSASTTGDVADITAANDFEILRRTVGSLGFGSIDLSQSGAVGTSRLDFTNIKQGAGLSVIGVAGNAAGNIADITAGSDHHVLRRSGTSIGFGTLNAAAMNSTYSASQVLTTDSSGNLSWAAPSGGGGLTNFTETRSTSAPNATVPAHTITPTGVETNIDFVIQPKGTGALIVATPDNATTGGNKRGQAAVDLQLQRSQASEIALGAWSFIGGGANNRAAGNYSACFGVNSRSAGLASIAGGASEVESLGDYSVAFGRTNVVSESDSAAFGAGNTISDKYCLVAGQQGSPWRRNQFVMGGTRISANGDSQLGMFSIRDAVTGVNITELSASLRAILRTNRVLNFSIQTIAVISVVGNGTGTLGHAFSITHHGAIKRIGNSTSLVGTPVILSEFSDTSMATCTMSITADDTNESLKIEFTPPTTAGTTTVIRVNCAVYFSEIGY